MGAKIVIAGTDSVGIYMAKTDILYAVSYTHLDVYKRQLGNGIDPLEIIDQYGADALGLTLITGNAPGNDMRFYNERVEDVYKRQRECR